MFFYNVTGLLGYESMGRRKKEYLAFRYRVLSRDNFVSPIFFLQLLLAVALDRRPVSCRVPPLNRLSSLRPLTNHKGRCMSDIISIPRPGDPRQTTVSDSSKVILCLAAPRFEHSTLLVRAKQHTGINRLALHQC
jgi:hypothetical protein